MKGHTWTWGVASGCGACAVRLYEWKRFDGWLVALDFGELVLIHSSTLWLLPITFWELLLYECVKAE